MCVYQRQLHSVVISWNIPFFELNYKLLLPSFFLFPLLLFNLLSLCSLSPGLCFDARKPKGIKTLWSYNDNADKFSVTSPIRKHNFYIKNVNKPFNMQKIKRWKTHMMLESVLWIFENCTVRTFFCFFWMWHFITKENKGLEVVIKIGMIDFIIKLAFVREVEMEWSN